MESMKTQYKVSDFISWMKSNSLILSPSFQRRPVWKKDAKSYLIDTIIRGLPIPILFVRERYTDIDSLEPKREVVDGQQRIRTLISYIKPDLLKDFNIDRDDFVINKAHNPEFANCKFSKLPIGIQRSILDYEFSVHVLPNNIDDRDILQIFARMNATGVKLNDQELRNAEYFGEFKTTVYEESVKQLNRWRTWKIFTEDNIARMSEVELTSELIIFILFGFESKSQKRINEVYELFDAKFPLNNIAGERFEIVMDEIENNMDTKIKDTIYSQKTVFYILFAIIYDGLFGIKSQLKKSSVSKIPQKKYQSIIDMGIKIKDDGIENILKSGTRRISTMNDRLSLFNYVIKRI